LTSMREPERRSLAELFSGEPAQIPAPFENQFRRKVSLEWMSGGRMFDEALKSVNLLDIAISASLLTLSDILVVSAFGPIPFVSMAATGVLYGGIELLLQDLKGKEGLQEWMSRWEERWKEQRYRFQPAWDGNGNVAYISFPLLSGPLKEPIEVESLFWGELDGEVSSLTFGVFERSLPLFLDGVKRQISAARYLGSLTRTQRESLIGELTGYATSPGWFADENARRAWDVRQAIEKILRQDPTEIAEAAFDVLMRAAGRPVARLYETGHESPFDLRLISFARQIQTSSERVRAIAPIALSWLRNENDGFTRLSNLVDNKARIVPASDPVSSQLGLTASRWLLQDWEQAATRISTDQQLIDQQLSELTKQGNEEGFVSWILSESERTELPFPVQGRRE
jgi:hypothetical protein